MLPAIIDHASASLVKPVSPHAMIDWLQVTLPAEARRIEEEIENAAP
jgi:hypothetical protein